MKHVNLILEDGHKISPFIPTWIESVPCKEKKYFHTALAIFVTLILSFSVNAQSLIGSGANQVPTNGLLGTMAFEDVANNPKVFSASVDASEAITMDETGFVSSCTNAAPSVCTLKTGHFKEIPLCWSQGAGSYVSATTITSATVERSADSTPFRLFCVEKR